MRSRTSPRGKRHRWLQHARAQLKKTTLAVSILAVTMGIIVGPYTHAGQQLSHHANQIIAEIAPVTTADNGGGPPQKVIAEVADSHATKPPPRLPSKAPA